MLKQEMRKLREDDMKMKRERQKRLDFLHKMKVLEKEKNYEQSIRSAKDN
jgi:hypothetical protein